MAKGSHQADIGVVLIVTYVSYLLVALTLAGWSLVMACSTQTKLYSNLRIIKEYFLKKVQQC